jgi:hypothetical protein
VKVLPEFRIKIDLPYHETSSEARPDVLLSVVKQQVKVKLSLYLTKHHVMKMYGGVKV